MRLLILSEELSLNSDSLIKSIAESYPEVDILEIKSVEDLRGTQYWNSILLYRFLEREMSEQNKKIIDHFNKICDFKGTIFPVSYGTNEVPPDSLKALKAYPVTSSRLIISRLGSQFGIHCIGKDHKVFISYRATDGKSHAFAINDILEKHGFDTWLDESKDEEGEGKIKIGEEAQRVLERDLSSCTVMVLVDTPQVASSDWVKKEIDVANSSLIPILPICYRTKSESGKGPRHLTLKALNRWIDVTDSEVDEEDLVKYLSDFLLDIYKRKRKISAIVGQTFMKKGYSWNPLDPKKLYFSSSKQLKFFLKHILSHCPIHNGLYPPYIQSFSTYKYNDDDSFNHRILVYDGEVLNKDEVNQLKSYLKTSKVDILHHQDLELALDEL